MNVYIIVYDSPSDRHPSGNPISNDRYVYATREIAQKHWKDLGHSRFGYNIKELEFLEE